MTKQADTDAIEELVAELEDEAQQLSGSSIRNGCPDCGISANLAHKAADTIADLRNKVAELRDTIIGLWHGGKDDRSLHECMGMTWEEYQAWIKFPPLATHRDDACQSSGNPA